MRSGALFEDFRAAFGQDDPERLVWKASTLLMNPTLKPERLERERRLDPSRLEREFEAAFPEDVDAFLPGAWVEGAVVQGRLELAADPGLNYVCAVDASGGGADAFTLAITDEEARDGEERRIVQDVMRGWRRKGDDALDLQGVVVDIAEVLERYGLPEAHGDRYAAGRVRPTFARFGIDYIPATLDKSAAYLEAQPLFAQDLLDLLDHPQLVRELKLTAAWWP